MEAIKAGRKLLSSWEMTKSFLFQLRASSEKCFESPRQTAVPRFRKSEAAILLAVMCQPRGARPLVAGLEKRESCGAWCAFHSLCLQRFRNKHHGNFASKKVFI